MRLRMKKNTKVEAQTRDEDKPINRKIEEDEIQADIENDAVLIKYNDDGTFVEDNLNETDGAMELSPEPLKTMRVQISIVEECAVK